MGTGLPNIFELISHPELYIGDYPLHTYYRGRVCDVKDPDYRGRVKVRVEEIWTSEGKSEFDQTVKVHVKDIPWADVMIQGQGDKSGFFFVPQVGTYVIVAFEKGHENYPIVIGGWFGNGEIPLAAKGGSEGLTDTGGALKGKDLNVATAGGGTISEPANPYAATYPNNSVFRTTSGHLIEVDETPSGERINITHKSGTWMEFHPDGKLVFGVQDDRYTVVSGDDGEHIKGSQDVVVDGNGTHSVAGDMKQEVQGRRVVEVLNRSTHTAAAITVESNSTLDLIAPGVTSIGPGVAAGDVVTTLTHPIDYITGIPILGNPLIKIG